MIAFLPLEHVNAAFGLTGPPTVLGFRVFGCRGLGWAHDSIPAFEHVNAAFGLTRPARVLGFGVSGFGVGS